MLKIYENMIKGYEKYKIKYPEKEKEYPLIGPNIYTYETLLIISSMIKDLHTVKNMVELIRTQPYQSEPIPLDFVTYRLLIHSLCQVNEKLLAFEYFSKMKKQKISSDLITYHSVLSLCNISEYYNNVPVLLNEMKEQYQLIPNKNTFKIILKKLYFT